MFSLIAEESWWIAASKFIGGPGLFLIIAILLVAVLAYRKIFKRK